MGELFWSTKIRRKSLAVCRTYVVVSNKMKSVAKNQARNLCTSLLLHLVWYTYLQKVCATYCLEWGGIGVCVKPQKRTKNYRKPRSASKIREDVHAVEAVEVRIFQRETGKIPNRIEWQIRKPDFIFAEKQKPRAK